MPPSSESLVFTVLAEALVDEALLDEEDVEVPGTYSFDLPGEAAHWTESQQAGAVLDAFHGSVAVGVLDDFEFRVLAPDGREIFEDEG